MKLSSLICVSVAIWSLANGKPLARSHQPAARSDKPTYTHVESERDIPSGVSKHLRVVLEKRQSGSSDGFAQGQPFSADGKGAVFSGGTNPELDLQNPDNVGQAYETDKGNVVNLKWAFSDSHTRLLKGGWVREQVVSDLPASGDIAAAQQHLTKGSIRELHWHRVAEWGYVYKGSVIMSAVDENGLSQVDTLQTGDIWYFPKGQAHTIQGVDDENEYLLVFDESDFDASGTTFMVDDWIKHTPKSILARNFGVDEDFFDSTPDDDPYILEANVTQDLGRVSPYGQLQGKASYAYHLSQMDIPEVEGGGGTIAIVDSRNFPIAETLAAAIVTVKPGGLREMHWHPNAEEWLYFVQGEARATVFMGSSTARTFNFRAGDTGVFPDNSGHYVENLSKTEPLVWIEMYKSDHVAEIPLSQWLAVTPHDIVAQTLNVSAAFVEKLKTRKQLILP